MPFSFGPEKLNSREETGRSCRFSLVKTGRNENKPEKIKV